jgi:hypothetical protein
MDLAEGEALRHTQFRNFKRSAGLSEDGCEHGWK